MIDQLLSTCECAGHHCAQFGVVATTVAGAYKISGLLQVLEYNLSNREHLGCSVCVWVMCDVIWCDVMWMCVHLIEACMHKSTYSGSVQLVDPANSDSQSETEKTEPANPQSKRWLSTGCQAGLASRLPRGNNSSKNTGAWCTSEHTFKVGAAGDRACESTKQALMEHWLSSRSCVAPSKGFPTKQALIEHWLSRRSLVVTFFFLAGLLRTLSARLLSTRFRFGKNVAFILIFLLSLILFIKVCTRKYILYLRPQTKRV